MPSLFDYFYIVATIALTVYGQLILKWRIVHFGALPIGFFEKLKFLFLLFLDPGIFSGFLAIALGSLTWMVAMTKFDLSQAYPYMGLNFVAVLLLSAWLLSEPLTLQKILGVGLIMLGTAVAAKG
jgi:multidrug transporter EmrE-like cation transporter